jgi:uncharacterized protein (DUF1330 family)
MKTRFTVTLSILAGAALGAAAVQGLHAQAKPPIYYVAEIGVTNPDAYGTEYAPKMQAIIKPHGGRQLAIGGTAGAGAKAAVTAFDGAAHRRRAKARYYLADGGRTAVHQPDHLDRHKSRGCVETR